MSKKNKTPMTIDMTDLLINSPNKLGRHLPWISSGCGVKKSKKDYTRKKKHKKSKVIDWGC